MEVLDTSVIYKWYVEENDTKKALAIFNAFKDGQTEICLPDLVIYELANILKFYPQNTENEVMEIIDNLSSLNLEIVVATTALIKNAVKLAYQYDITVYDATFVALAQDLGYRFITADKKLQDKIKTLPFVYLLRDVLI